jgi:6-phospho-beta-glucosidase
MKIAILGAGGVRTPLMVQAMAIRQERIGLDELALMDIDSEHLELIGALTTPLEVAGKEHGGGHLRFTINRTTDARQALTGADFVITTFRVGGINSRVVDERAPLNLGLLGQETTGAGGFAMGLRTVPVILDYVTQMRSVCPNAWLINFANPAGMLAEAVWREAGWKRVVGICDAPPSMGRVAAALVGAPADEVYLDYFGLNHLGWLRSVVYGGIDFMGQFLEMLPKLGAVPGLPFDPALLQSLGMIPNEYLYYYYYARQAVDHILRAGVARGEQIASLNKKLFADLRQFWDTEDLESMNAAYQAYLEQRGDSYMVTETGYAINELDPKLAEALSGEGYAGVALDLIEALLGKKPGALVLNLPNRGAIYGMEADDVVEIPAFVGRDLIQPLAVGEIPGHCLGLMKQVKAYERLTIAAATRGSYSMALQALTIHPLVRDYDLAKKVLDGYIHGHGSYFPVLQ